MTAALLPAGDLTDLDTSAVVRALRAAGTSNCARTRMEPSARERLRAALVAEAKHSWGAEARILPFAPSSSSARSTRAAGRDARVLQPASA